MAKRLIMAVIDGCHQKTLYDLIDKGEMPFFNEILKTGTRVRSAVTMFPSTTVACCSSLYTGCWYRNHGILDNEWFDRFDTPPRARSYIAGLHYALESLDRKLWGAPSILLPNINKGGAANNDLEAPTIYEDFTRAGLKSYTMFHYIGRGATKWIRPGRMDMLRYGLVEQFEKPYEMYEKHMVSSAIINARKGRPDVISLYFGGNDGNSHRHGVPGQLPYLRDFIDGEFMRMKKAAEQIYPGDDIYSAITADHGQTNMNPDDIDRSMYYQDMQPVLAASGFDKSEQGLSMSEHDLGQMDAVISLGNGATFSFYLRNRDTRDWKTQPDYANDVLPFLNNLLKAGDRLPPFGNWPFPRYVDFILTRTKFDEPYSIYANDPPYEGEGRLVDPETFFDGREGYCRPVERIRGIDHPKGPDVKLVLNYADHFNVQERAEFHAGQHGSLNADDSIVPMIFAGPGVRTDELDDALTIDFSPTCAALMGVEMPRADGKPLPVFI